VVSHWLVDDRQSVDEPLLDVGRLYCIGIESIESFQVTECRPSVCDLGSSTVSRQSEDEFLERLQCDKSAGRRISVVRPRRRANDSIRVWERP
jgi:hypothetical protein